MADAITIILRGTGEAPDPALQGCRVAQGFGRLILCLAALQRAEARVFQTSLGDPDHEARLTEVEALWAECSDRLALFAYPPMEPEPAAVPVVRAARLMQGWLAARSTFANQVGAA